MMVAQCSFLGEFVNKILYHFSGSDNDEIPPIHPELSVPGDQQDQKELPEEEQYGKGQQYLYVPDGPKFWDAKEIGDKYR